MVRLFDKALLSKAEGLSAHRERLNLKRSRFEMKAGLSTQAGAKRSGLDLTGL